MSQVIVYTRLDGNISVFRPSVGVSIATALARAIPSGATDIAVIDGATVPTDHTFRDAWVQTAGNITVDMPKARAIHAVHLARARAGESARLGLAEAEARLRGKTTEANKAVADKAAVDGLDLATLAAQMAAASNPTALQAVWSPLVPRPA